MTTKFQTKCSCIKCKVETTTGQLTRNHVQKCPIKRYPTKFPNNFGRPAWNKGLTSKIDLRVKNIADIQRGKSKPALSQEHKDRLSIVAKKRCFGGYRENAGRSKKFKVYDSFGNQKTLQSTYEYAVFEILSELEIRWVRPKAFKYDDKNYFADFHLIDFDIWLDPKNDYKAKLDAEKIQKVIKQNNIKLFVLSQKQITKEYIGRVVQW